MPRSSESLVWRAKFKPGCSERVRGQDRAGGAESKDQQLLCLLFSTSMKVDGNFAGP